MAKKKKIALVVYHHEYNSVEYLTEIIRLTLGYDVTQAATCANLVIDKQSYIVKTYKDETKAQRYLQLFIDQEIPAELKLID